MKTTSNTFAVPAVTAAFGLAISLGCAQQTRQRWMHFFFEIPTKPQAASAAGQTTRSPAPDTPEPFTLPPARFAVVHNPILTRQCVACHDPAVRMAPREELADACRTCHSEFASIDEGHAPVVFGECGTCHEMHRSPHAGLLRRPAYDLCIECHDVPEDLSAEAHRVAAVERCTNCHDPHFGSGALLKAGYERFLVSAAPDRPGE